MFTNLSIAEILELMGHRTLYIKYLKDSDVSNCEYLTFEKFIDIYIN